MCVKLDILKYLQIFNHTTSSLVYISRLLNIHTKYSIDDIQSFYTQYSYITKDVNVSSKLGLSINYVLTNNFDLLRIIDDNLFIQLLTDYESDLILPDDLELRLVSIINILLDDKPCPLRINNVSDDKFRPVSINNVSDDKPCPLSINNISDDNICLLRYISKYKNKLLFSKLSVKYVNNSVSYYMSYTGSNIDIIKQIILKSCDTNYKAELDKYICTQGCINNILMYNCMVLNIYKVLYVNNIDINECRKNICYKHFVEYLDKSRMFIRYFVNEGSLEIILKYPEYISVQEFIKKVEEDIIFIHSDIFLVFSKEEIILIFYIFRKQYNSQDASLIISKCKEYLELFTEFSYNIDLSNQISICENKFNKEYENTVEFNSEEFENNLDGFIDEYIKKYEIFYNNSNEENCNERGIKCRKISVTDIRINNDDINSVVNSKMLLSILEFDKNTCIKIIKYKDIKVDEIFIFLESVFIKYDFKFIYELIVEILNLHGKNIIDRIQIYILDILEEGFFEECYFDMIKSIYNKLLSYSTTIKAKKNNDSILILLSRYCKYFSKDLYLGNLKK